MDTLHTLADAAALAGIPFNTLKSNVARGLTPAVKVKRGAREVWAITQATLDQLQQPQVSGQWQQLYDQWIREQASGYYRKKPLGRNSIQTNEYGLKYYWRFLGENPSIPGFSAQNLAKALSNVPVDYETGKCHYAQREHMYKAFRSMAQTLIREGLKSKSILDEILPLKPSRVYPERQTVIRDGDKALSLLEKPVLNGNTEYDACLNTLILSLGCLAGLRLSELLRLRVSHVDLDLRIIQVIDGKGHKNRDVGMPDLLHQHVSQWLTDYRPRVVYDELLISRSHRPFAQRALARRIERLSDKHGIDFTSHGLRRTFATMLANMGVPLSDIQMLLGHEDIKTTMKYVKPDVQKAIQSSMRLGQVKKEEKPLNLLEELLFDE